VLWKAPQKLTPRQEIRLGEIQRTNRPLYRAYLLKEQLREIVSHRGPGASELLDRWLAWAARSRLPQFVTLGRQIRRHRRGLVAALVNRLTNARTEGVNTKLRLLHRLAFGFHSTKAFIALGMLRLAGICPPLPGRA
jgi:transposase